MSSGPDFLLRSVGHVLLLNQVARGPYCAIYTAMGPRDPQDLKKPLGLQSLEISSLSRVYVVKECLRRKGYDHSLEKERYCHEAVSGHEGVVRLHHTVMDETALYLIMEYCPEGDLFTSIDENLASYQHNPEHTKGLILQLLAAVEHCHRNNVFHRDLKTENILLRDCGTRVLLADFGLSTCQERSVEFSTGSDPYMSPECLAELHCSAPYSSAATDVWSLGIIIFEMVMGHQPWDKASVSCPSFASYLHDPYYFLRNYPISPSLNTLLLQALAIDPSQRCSLRALHDAVERTPSFLITDSRELRRIRLQHLRDLDISLMRSRIRSFGTLFDPEKYLLDRGIHESQLHSFSRPRDEVRTQLMHFHDQFSLQRIPKSYRSNAAPGPPPLDLDALDLDTQALLEDPILLHPTHAPSFSNSSTSSTLVATPESLAHTLPLTISQPLNIVSMSSDLSRLTISVDQSSSSPTPPFEMDLDNVVPSTVLDLHVSPTQPLAPKDLLDFMCGNFGQMGGAFEKKKLIFTEPLAPLVHQPPLPDTINIRRRSHRYVVEKGDVMYRPCAATSHMV